MSNRIYGPGSIRQREYCCTGCGVLFETHGRAFERKRCPKCFVNPMVFRLEHSIWKRWGEQFPEASCD